jgi:hypothetical protein
MFETQGARSQTAYASKWKKFFCDVQAPKFLFRSINDKFGRPFHPALPEGAKNNAHSRRRPYQTPK